MTNPAHIIPLVACESAAESLVGIKAQKLGRLLKSGLPVPPGIVLSRHAFRYFLHEYDAATLDHVLANLSLHDPVALQQAGNYIRTSIKAKPFPPELAANLKDYLDQYIHSDTVAIRVSQTLPQTPKLSRTKFVEGENNILEAIREIWSATFSDHLLHWLIKHHKSLSEIHTAVLIQPLIDTQVAGLAWSRHPDHHDKRSLLIKAVFGNGQTLLQHPEQADQIVIDKYTGDIIEQTNHQQTQMLVLSGDKVVSRSVDEVMQPARKLGPQQIKNLVKEINHITQTTFFPQIVEWGIADKKIVIFETSALENLPLAQSDVRSAFSLPKAHLDLHKPAANPRQPRIMLTISDSNQLNSRVARQADGIGLLKAEVVMSSLQLHPRLLIRQSQQHRLVETLAQYIQSACHTMDSKRVIYRLSDFTSDQLSQLEGGDSLEPVETNPLIGYRGAWRYMTDRESFRLELLAIKKVLAAGYTNLNLMIPFVRTIAELELIQALLRDAELEPASLPVWLMVDTPAVAITLDQFFRQGLAGVAIGSRDLLQLLTGTDLNSQQQLNLNLASTPAFWRIIKDMARATKTADIPLLFCEQSVTRDLADRLMETGVTHISVEPNQLAVVREWIET